MPTPHHFSPRRHSALIYDRAHAYDSPLSSFQFTRQSVCRCLGVVYSKLTVTRPAITIYLFIYLSICIYQGVGMVGLKPGRAGFHQHQFPHECLGSLTLSIFMYKSCFHFTGNTNKKGSANTKGSPGGKACCGGSLGVPRIRPQHTLATHGKEIRKDKQKYVNH